MLVLVQSVRSGTKCWVWYKVLGLVQSVGSGAVLDLVHSCVNIVAPY